MVGGRGLGVFLLLEGVALRRRLIFGSGCHDEIVGIERG